MEIITQVVGPVRTNCYIAFDPQTKKGFIVDPGDDAGQILRHIADKKLDITHVFCTHGHFDHILALSAVKEATGALVCVHAADQAMLASASNNLLKHFGGNRFSPVQPDILLAEGLEIACAGVTLEVLHTPGHTPGSVCLDSGGLLFSGDTLFASSCGRTDFPGGDMDAMMMSLRRLASLPGDRRAFPGHDSAFTLEEARRSNPFLREAVR